MPPADGDRLLLASACVRAMAASALRGRLARRRFPGGIIALDFFGDEDLRGGPVRVLSVARDLGRGRTVADLGRAAGALAWQALAVGGGFENRPGLLRLLARRGRLLGSAPGAVRAVRDPAVLFPWLAARGLPHAATWVGDRAPRDRRERLLKRRRGAGGSGVLPAPPGGAVPPGWYLQEHLAGRPGSAAFLADGRDAVLLGVSEQISGAAWLGAAGFRHAGNLVDATGLARGPDRLLSEEGAEAAHRIAAALADRFGLRGLAGFDFIAVDGLPRLIEVNPRWTASMELIEEARSASLFDAHLLAAGGDEPVGAAVRAAGGAAGGAPAAHILGRGVLYAGGAVMAPPPATLAALGARDRPREGEVIPQGQPVCTLTAVASSRAGALARLGESAVIVRALLAPSPVPAAPPWAGRAADRPAR